MSERYNTHIAQCRECGEEHFGNWCEEVSAALVEAQLCWSCFFWLRHVQQAGAPNQVRVEGQLYYILPDNATQVVSAKGSGGLTFHLKFLDGRAESFVTTTNLWTCGPIPEAFRDRLPDNAVFTDHKGERLVARGAIRSWEEIERYIEQRERRRK